MKTLQKLAGIFAILCLTSVTSHARGSQRGQPQTPGTRGAPPADGLQSAASLQPATSLEGSSFGPRLTDEAWRKLFPQKAPAN